MSASAHVAELAPGRQRPARARPYAAGFADRPLVRLAAFAALGLYGTMRWATLLTPAPTWRLFGLLGLSLLVAGVLRPLSALSRPAALAGAAVAVLAALPLAGVPLAWVVHVRISVSADAIGQGLSALPGVLVPYAGINQWVRVVIVLGAGVLLLDAALMFAFAPRTPGDLRRGVAALPLVALAVVPSTLARPAHSYMHGLLLFGLLAAFMWAERVRHRELASAVAIAGLAGVAAVLAAPALDQRTPWLDYQSLARTLAPAHVVRFDWSQRYGPLHSPRTGREVLDVQATRADYWKAENLDVFDGTRWLAGTVDTGEQLPALDPSAVARWTQTLQVTIRAMRTTDVIASGFASPPAHVAEGVLAGVSPGTWSAGTDLGPGDSYLVSTYAPHPSPTELAAAGTNYPALLLRGYLSIMMPQPADLPAQQVVFAPFGSPTGPQNVTDVATITAPAAIAASPYARAVALARRLARRAATPYAYVANVESYLAGGFKYDENPPSRSYALESFLFKDKRGYCQQFSGAMALLLRMGGIPARVAAGFTPGSHDDATRRWVVRDLDAHAWVEAWFPRLGWVRFDPTPASAPARGGQAPTPSLRGLAGAPKPRVPVRRRVSAPAAINGRATSHAGTPAATLLLASFVALLALIVVARSRRRLGEPTGDELLAELERALARSGRPIAGGVTLVALEHGFRSSPGAVDYVRAIRLARFGGADERPTPAQRRALRAQLRQGLGVVGRLRVFWTMPPRGHRFRAGRRSKARDPLPPGLNSG